MQVGLNTYINKKKKNKYNSEIKNLNGFCIVHIIHNYLIERTFLM
jgi:hypothetical protein